MQTNFEIDNKQIEKFLQYLIDFDDLKDIDENVYKLKSLGYNLVKIDKDGYSISGIFRNKNFNKVFYVPYYEIHEDILEQLAAVFDDFSGTALNPIDENSIYWDSVFESESYNKLFFNTSIELLYCKLDIYLKNHQ